MNQYHLIFFFAVLATGPVITPAGLESARGVSDPSPWLNFEQALTEARETGRPVLVYVRAPWCGPCRRLEHETFTDPAIRLLLEGFVLARLTIDDHDRMHRAGPYRLSEAGWAARLGAESTPTLVFLSSEGAHLGRSLGFLPPEGLLPILGAVLAGPSDPPVQPQLPAPQ